MMSPDTSLHRMGVFRLRRKSPWGVMHYAAFHDKERDVVIVVGVENEHQLGTWTGAPSKFMREFVPLSDDGEEMA